MSFESTPKTFTESELNDIINRNANVEEYVTYGKDIAFDGVNITRDTQIEAVKTGIKNGKFNLSEAGDINTFARQKGVRVVYYASEDAGNHGAILADGKTIAINTLSDVSKYSTIAHEYIHSVYTNNHSEYVKLVEDIRSLRKTDNEFNALVERVMHDVENAYKNEYVDSRVITRARLIEQEVTARLVEELLFDRKNASSSATKSGKGIARLLGLSDEGMLTRLKKFFTHLRNRLNGTSMSSEVQTVDDLISEIEELIAKGKIKKSTKSQTAIDNGGSLLYSKKSYYTQWRSDALAWANKASTEVGDRNVGYDSKYAYLYEATDPDGEEKATDFVVLRRESRENDTGIDDLYRRMYENNNRINSRNGRADNGIYEGFGQDAYTGGLAENDSSNVLGQRAGNGRDDGVSRGASERDGSGRTQSSDRYSPEVRPATDRRGLNQDSDNVRKSKSLPETDSDGRKLTDTQREYFAGSEVVDKEGRLLVVYHGSPAVFNEFSYRFMNATGNAHGRGFYFSEDVNLADKFMEEGGQLLRGYLDIKKPASETTITIRKAELVKLVKATCEAQARELMVEESYDNMRDALLDTWVSNYVDTYSAYSMDAVYKQVAESILNYCDNDVDVFAEITNVCGTKRTLSLIKKVIGYDGVIYDKGDGTHEFVAFESNQFKNVTNVNPTENADIRYSKDTFKEGTQNNSYAMSWARATMRVEGEKTIIGNKVIVADDTDIGYHIIKDVSRYSRKKIKWVQDTIDADNQFIRESIKRTRSFDDEAESGYRHNHDIGSLDDTGTVGQRRGRVLRQDGARESGENVGVREEVSGRDGRDANQGSASDIRSDKVRRSLDKDDDVKGNYTVGQRAKFVANNTQMKVYSRADAEAVISTILSERLSFDDGKYATLAGKDKKTVVLFIA